MQDPFTFFITKNSKLIISRDNKQIKIIKGKSFEEFKNLLQSGSEEDIQLKLAKLTGNYKHGNEDQN